MAEAVFLHYNKNKNIKAKSAGVALASSGLYVTENVSRIMKDRGTEIKDNKSHNMSEKLIKWADKIIVVADNVDSTIFPDEKLEVWNVTDTSSEDIEGIVERITIIDKRVKDFIKSVRVNV